MLKDIAEEFDRWAHAGRAEEMALGHQNVTHKMLNAVQFDSSMTVCDIGCGNGWAVREMLSRGAGTGLGIDISPQMIVLADSLATPSEEYMVSSASKIPKLNDSIDFILSVESLYYHPNPLETLQECFRVLKKNSSMFVMVDLYTENVATHAWIDALSLSVHLFSIDQYCDLFKQVGFKQIEFEQMKSEAPIKSRLEFNTSVYWPSYENYLDYRKTGSLVIRAQKI